MHLCDLTLLTPEENVAFDEALLDACEDGELAAPVLRVWEPGDYFVVLGRSSPASTEVNIAACRAAQVPVLRRVSGGGTVLAGPGCLMYAVVLPYANHCPPRDIAKAHRVVLSRVAEGLAPLVPGIELAGTSDLAFGQNGTLQKFSGNSLRMKRTHFLYHGTLLYNFALDRVGRFLARPTYEPDYRAGRGHGEFITNLPATREQLVAALARAWQATPSPTTWPQDRLRDLVQKIGRE